jgi:general secretion pathway protein N
VAPKSAGPQSPEFALIGTVIGEEESIAVFADETTKNAIRLRTGEAHKGWALRSVHAREATLERGGESAILGLLRPGTEQTASIPRPTAERPANRRR